MIKRGIINKKRGNLVIGSVVFIVLNLVVASLLLFFVYKESTGAGVYEEAYAKQIGLFLDGAKPNMRIDINFSEGLKVAKKNEYNGNVILKEDSVVVQLAPGKGYEFKFFTDYDVNSYIDKEILVLNIGEKIREKVDKGGLGFEEDFSSVYTLEDVENAIFYLRDNELEKRNCFCGNEKTCFKYAEWIYHYSSKVDINPLIVLSIIAQESNCIYDSVSNNDTGLMQINSGVWCGEKAGKNLPENHISCKEVLKNPEDNIRVGTEILQEYQKSVKDYKLLLASYNWGITSIINNCVKMNLNSFEECKVVIQNRANRVVDYVEKTTNRYSKLKEGGVIYVARN